MQYDYDVTYWQAAPYAQTEFTLTDESRWSRASLRQPRLQLRATGWPPATGSHRRPASTNVSFSRLTPKLGAAWEFAAGGMTVFGSYRAAFRAPSESQLFRQGRAESTVDLGAGEGGAACKGGVRALIGGRATVEATVYSMRLRDDILTFIDPAGLRLTQNAGAT